MIMIMIINIVIMLFRNVKLIYIKLNSLRRFR